MGVLDDEQQHWLKRYFNKFRQEAAVERNEQDAVQRGQEQEGGKQEGLEAMC